MLTLPEISRLKYFTQLNSGSQQIANSSSGSIQSVSLTKETSMLRLLKMSIPGLLAVLLLLASLNTSAQTASHEVLIKNAIVMTVTHGNIQGGSVYVKDGKIAAVGKDVTAPADVTVIDAGGKYLTPGIVDSHSHIALDDDVNEATSPVTPQMMMIDAFDYQDKAIFRGLGGGGKNSLLLHGSAKMIGGQAI